MNDKIAEVDHGSSLNFMSLVNPFVEAFYKELGDDHPINEAILDYYNPTRADNICIDDKVAPPYLDIALAFECFYSLVMNKYAQNQEAKIKLCEAYADKALLEEAVATTLKEREARNAGFKEKLNCA